MNRQTIHGTMTVTACVLAALLPTGCAHHRADQYAFAPPYAPPVYPQPQVHLPAQPASSATTGLPVAAAPVAGLPAAPMLAGGQAVPAGTVITAGGECPPCGPGGGEGVVLGAATVPTTMLDASGQTPPCPPGP